MDSVRRPFVLKAIAFFLAVTVFTTLFPSGLTVRAENGSGIQVTFPYDEYNITSDGLTYNEASKDNAVDALYEEISLRTPNSKTLRMNDGMYRIGTYGFEIHFPTSEGYEEYDNTLKLSDGYYSPTKSDAEMYFSESKPEYRISYGGTEVSFTLLGDNLKEPVVEIGELPEEEYSTKAARLFSVPKAKSKIDYINVLDGVTLSYLIYGKNIKESIILASPSAASEFRFLIRTEAEVFTDDEGNIVFGESVIPRAYMIDSDGAESLEIQYILEPAEGGYILTLVPDTEWLKDGDRVYPVIIDPTIHNDSPSTSEIKDAYVEEGTPAYNSGYDSILHVGNAKYDSSMKRLRTYIKFQNLPSIPQSAEISKATYSIQQTRNNAWYSYASSSEDYLIITASKVTSGWSDTTVTWNNQPSFSSIIVDYSVATADTAELCLTFDITSCMQEWYSNSSSNYGIVLQSSDESADGHVGFISVNDTTYSSTDPILDITYYDTKGIDSRWTYLTEDAGTAGELYVNLYNGQPVLLGPSIDTQDALLPLSVYPVYNGYMAGKQFVRNPSDIDSPVTASFNSSVGYGFKLSCWESMTVWQISDETYYCLNDADGTELYFRYYEDCNAFLSEDGFDMTLTIGVTSDAYYIVSDSSGNVKYFDINGRIRCIHDESGNKKYFNYNAQGRLESISFLSASMDRISASPETELTFSYNSAGGLSKITNAKDTGIYMEFYYSSTYNGSVSQSNTGYLRKIIYSGGDYAEYQYLSSGKLYIMRQGHGSVPGTYVSISYSGGNVSYVSGYSASGSLGTKCSVSYESKKATVRTAGKDDIFYNSDDLLNVVLFDNYGKAVTSYCTDFDGNITYGATSAGYVQNNLYANPKSNNALTQTASRGEYFRNLITNGSLEHSYGWSVIVGDAYASISYVNTESLYGTGSVRMYGGSSICTGVIRQTVYITEPGTYTLSAYVKSNLLMGFQSGTTINGAYISLDGEMSEIVSGQTDSGIRDGWQKISVTKTITSSGTYNVDLNLRNMYYDVFFDGVSLIKNDVAETEFNYFGNQWINCQSLTEQGNGVSMLTAAPGGSANAYTIVNLNKPAAETAFFVSGWSYGYSIPENDLTNYPASVPEFARNKRFWGIKAEIYYQDNSFEIVDVLTFNPDVSGEWQYASGVVMPSKENLDKNIVCIYFRVMFENNANYVLLKDFSITETDAVCYTYNENGDIERVRSANSNTDVEYLTNQDNVLTNLVEEVNNSSGEAHTYTYYDGTHRIDTITDEQGIQSKYTYNTEGLPVSTVVSPSSGTLRITTGTTYDRYGNAIYVSDNFNHTTIYSYNTNRRLLNYVTNANGSRTQYVYDLMGKITDIYNDTDQDGVRDSGEAGVSYTYNSHNLLTAIYNGATTYHFTYDGFGNVISVSTGSDTAPLVSYTYAAYNGKLLSTTYADGTVISNTYDEINRIKAVSYNGNVAYTVTYDGEGNIESYTDCSTGRVYRYEYDAMGREIRYIVTQGGSVLYSAEKTYDTKGNVSGYSYNIPGVNSRSSSNTFDEYNNLTGTVTAGGDTITYTYDGFGRTVTKTTGAYSEHYEYKTSGSNTSALLSKITYKRNGTTYKTVSYTYDSIGNILTEDDGTTYRSYTYDSLNQLATDLYYDKSTGIGKYRSYFISKSGNVGYIEFNYNNGTYSSSSSSGHSYGSGTEWKDLMTSYGGVSITYDANGNPLSYYNGQNYTFTWQKGRQLSSAYTGGILSTYAYDVIGKRITKNAGGTVHSYTYDGSLLLCDKWGTQYIEYFYDAEGYPYALNYYNGTSSVKYYFVRNAAGDILELRTLSGGLTAKYIYDAWGKIVGVKDSSGNEITSSSHIANLNALRYRGYFYDNETGLYYLESRYYDPQTQRFINSDRIEILGTGGDILSYNAFAYCENNPVNRADHDGNFWHIVAGAVFGAIGGAVSSIVSQAVSGQEINWKAVGISAASGAISGAITAACPCMAPLTAGITQGTLSAATYAVTEKVAYGRDPTFVDTLKVGLRSGLSAGLIQYAGQELGLIQCFISGTIVSTKDGPTKIEDIQVGDFVWATDPETGETSLREVVQLFRNETYEWVHLTVNGEEIVCTPEHPFYSPVKGWTAACKLRAGDILVTVNGEYVVLEKIQHELLESSETTYNFEVEGFHTYYVGSTEVLVHNSCGDLGSYSSLKSSGAGKGNEIHHIIEKRFSEILGINPNQMPSVVLNHSTHLNYTQLWRKAIPYGSTPEASMILKAAETIYQNNSELLAWARFTIIGG